jgi:type II secretory pathway pseudopilin PulG
VPVFVTRRRRTGKAGLTLIELLFAVSILAFVTLGVAGMFPAAYRSVLRGGQVTKAVQLAQSMADMIRMEPFDDLLTVPTAANYYKGFNGYDSRSHPPSVACPYPDPTQRFQPFSPDGYDPGHNKKKWRCSLLSDAGDVSGQGLPGGYGTVAVACLNPDGTVNATNPCSTGLLRVSITVNWQSGPSRSVVVTTNVARHE